MRGRKHTVGDFQRIEVDFLVSEWNRVKAKVKRGGPLWRLWYTYAVSLKFPNLGMPIGFFRRSRFFRNASGTHMPIVFFRCSNSRITEWGFELPRKLGPPLLAK